MKIEEAVFPNLPQRLSGLAELAENLWWSWHAAARMLFKMLNRQAWKESSHNPDKMLKELPGEILESAASDPEYLRQYDAVLAQFQEDMAADDICLTEPDTEPHHCTIAFFSAEYGLHHSLPFYAGALGFGAGDFIKECSDLRVALTAVGFLYPEGYVRQEIREDGWQKNLDEVLDREAASISRVFDETGNQLLVKVPCIEHRYLWQYGE